MEDIQIVNLINACMEQAYWKDEGDTGNLNNLEMNGFCKTKGKKNCT